MGSLCMLYWQSLRRAIFDSPVEVSTESEILISGDLTSQPHFHKL